MKLSKDVAAHAGLEVVVGDASQAESIADLARGTDVVVSCLGGRSRSDTIVSTTVRSLLTEITNNSNQQRLIAMTSIGCGRTSPLVKFGLQAMFGFTMIGDLNVADKLLLDSPIRSQTVIVRPPRIDDAPVGSKGKYVGTVEFPRGSPIMSAMTQADVAAFIVDAAERADWDGKAVQLYSAK